MLTLIKAEEIFHLGLTTTQVFYLIGREASKKLCRFVKRDSIHTAVSTLLAMKGKPSRVEDIRLTEAYGGLKVWTGDGDENIASAEVRAFLTRYNKLARHGCASECNCQENSEELWKQYCIHRIAEHLANAKDKVEAILKTRKTATQRVEEVMAAALREGLLTELVEDEGDSIIKVSHEGQGELGHIIVTENASLFVSVQRRSERQAWSVFGALSLLTDLVPKPKQEPDVEGVANLVRFRQLKIFDTVYQAANRHW